MLTTVLVRNILACTDPATILLINSLWQIDLKRDVRQYARIFCLELAMPYYNMFDVAPEFPIAFMILFLDILY